MKKPPLNLAVILNQEGAEKLACHLDKLAPHLPTGRISKVTRQMRDEHLRIVRLIANTTGHGVDEVCQIALEEGLKALLKDA